MESTECRDQLTVALEVAILMGMLPWLAAHKLLSFLSSEDVISQWPPTKLIGRVTGIGHQKVGNYKRPFGLLALIGVRVPVAKQDYVFAKIIFLQTERSIQDIEICFVVCTYLHNKQNERTAFTQLPLFHHNEVHMPYYI